MMASNSMGATLIMLILVALGAEVAGDNGPALKYWEKKLPGMAVPAPLREAVSPVEGSVLASLFATQIQHGAIYPSASASFCKKAGLVCEDEKVDFGNPLDKVQYFIYYKLLDDKLVDDKPTENQLDKVPSYHSKLADEASDPSLGYFLDTDLFEGATLRLKEQAPIQPRPFLPRVVADALPALVPENLHKLQRIFNTKEGTGIYNELKAATIVCAKDSALDVEYRVCPASLESFVDVLSSHVGPDVKVLTNSPRPRVVMGPMHVSNFTVHHSVEDNLNVVICHVLSFPSKLYLCHSLPDTKVIEASLIDADGVEVGALGVCHLDTKTWYPGLQAFEILGIRPGTPVCHWTAQETMVFYATNSGESSVVQESVGHGHGDMAVAMKPGHDHIMEM